MPRHEDIAQRETENKRFEISQKKQEEVRERAEHEAKLRARRDEEERRMLQKRREEDLLRKKAEDDRHKREQDEKKKVRDDEERRHREESDRQKRVEQELKKKLDDDKKRSEERRKKIEADRHVRLEEERRITEARRVAQEEELRRLEQENSEMLFKAANNDFSFLSMPARSELPPAPEIDLLAGSEDGASVDSRDDDDIYSYEGDSRSETSWQAESNASRSSETDHEYRKAPQRGKIDEATDDALDRISVGAITLKKQGKNDGTYLFGQRMMKVRLDSYTRRPVVVVGRENMELRDFVEKFRRVETVRQKGLASAIAASQFLASGGVLSAPAADK
eukprot:TRINITY_DN2786_c0_g1_i1.p1 TRINITY_DN2786_c0_g1~~TRINITY_DN2786_c0_g1_i1.p1  ORF type:complete len:336 (+),score=84.76 TRINITY_DN2786_c0_g1_i1:90-1097(+)